MALNVKTPYKQKTEVKSIISSLRTWAFNCIINQSIHHTVE